MLDAPDANALFASDIVRSNGASIASTISQLENAVISDLNSEWRLAMPSYSDQVLPFNVTLAGANEYGAMCASKILGIEILNEGSGISVDDAVTESQATFVARGIEPLQAVTSPYNQVPSSFPKQQTLARTRGRNRRQQPIWHPESRQRTRQTVPAYPGLTCREAFRTKTDQKRRGTAFPASSTVTYGTKRHFWAAKFPP